MKFISETFTVVGFIFLLSAFWMHPDLQKKALFTGLSCQIVAAVTKPEKS